MQASLRVEAAAKASPLGRPAKKRAAQPPTPILVTTRARSSPAPRADRKIPVNRKPPVQLYEYEKRALRENTQIWLAGVIGFPIVLFLNISPYLHYDQGWRLESSQRGSGQVQLSALLRKQASLSIAAERYKHVAQNSQPKGMAGPCPAPALPGQSDRHVHVSTFKDGGYLVRLPGQRISGAHQLRQSPVFSSHHL